MVSTLEGLLVLTIILLPGALYTWSFEQQAGAWGINNSDRVMRFVGSSAIFHAVAVPLTWQLVSRYAHGITPGTDMPWYAWPLALAYVVLPYAAGRITGRGVRQRKRWAHLLTGPAPAPRAWDQVFSGGQSAWIRIRLKDTSGGTGGWIVGTFTPATSGPDSYAAGFPHNQDLYLTDTVEVEPDRGRPLLDLDRKVKSRGYGVLIRWEEIAYVEVRWA